MLDFKKRLRRFIAFFLHYIYLYNPRDCPTNTIAFFVAECISLDKTRQLFLYNSSRLKGLRVSGLGKNTRGTKRNLRENHK